MVELVAPEELRQQIEQGIIEEMLDELAARFLGPHKKIYCYRLVDGSCPIRDFLEEQELRVKATYHKQFEKVCIGANLRAERWKPWTEDDGKGCKGLFEYKDISSKTRIMHLMEGNIHVLLFGFSGKKEDKVEPGHVKRAIDMKAEYLARRERIAQRVNSKKGIKK